MKQIYNIIIALLTLAISTLQLHGQTPVGTPAGSFAVTPMGGASYGVAIEAPKGVHGMEPQISVNYNSQAGNGMAGWGCSIGGISAITVGPRDIYHDGQACGIRYDLDDAYYLDGQRLIEEGSHVSGSDSAVYHPEGNPYTRVVLHGRNSSSQSVAWFSVKTPDGMQYEYGKFGNNRGNDYFYHYGEQRACTERWYISRAVSATGETIDYYYQKTDGMLYPSYIMYGAYPFYSYVRFAYQERPDTLTVRRCGDTTMMTRRLRTVTTSTDSCGTEKDYRRYTLSYDNNIDGATTRFSRLVNITESNGMEETLNPVEFTWSGLQAFSTSSTTPPVTLKSPDHFVRFDDFDLLSADFNGDGYADIIQHAHGLLIDNGSHTRNFFFIFLSGFDYNGNLSYSAVPVTYELSGNIVTNNWTDYMSMPIITDVDGDGLQDMIVPYVVGDVNNATVFVYILGKDVTEGRTSAYVERGYMLRHSTDSPIYTSADFDNDGHGDLAILETQGTAGAYDLHFMRGGLNGTVTEYHTTLSINSAPKKMYAADFNSDGLADIMAVCQYGYTIFWNTGNTFSQGIFQSTNIHSGSTVTDAAMLQPGDFNGDGQVDFLSNTKDCNEWYFLLGNGNGDFQQTLACEVDAYEQSGTSDDDKSFSCHILDLDGDGKSDAVIEKAMFKKHHDLVSTYYRFQKTHTYWLLSDGHSMSQLSHATSNKEQDAFAGHYMTGDFNGDGLLEIAHYGYNCYNATDANVTSSIRNFKNQNYSTLSGRVFLVEDGLGNSSSISYKFLTDRTVYTKTEDSSFPLVTMTVPLAVVSSVTQTNGAASGTEMMSYSYKNLQLVQQGRGSLGFSYSKVTNSTTGVSTETEVTHKSPQSYYPLTTVETQTIGNSTATRTSHYSASFIGGTRKVYHSLLSTTETDHDGYATVTAYEYDSLHNSVPLSVTVTGFDGSTTQTIYASYVLKGGAYLPQSVTQVDSQPGSNPFTDQTWHEYDGKGRETLCVQHYGKPEALTTAYTYNSSGNLSQTVTTGTDIETVTNTYEWDNSRRFITRSVERGYIVNEYTYDLWGNVLTETDKTRSACPETTTHTYDGWGHPATVTSPLGITTTYSRGWGTTQAKRYYVLEQGQGRPFVKTWYDACGREVLTESVGLLGVTVSAATAYNAKGLVSQRQAVEGSRTVTEAFNYDARGRLLNSSVTPGPTTCYSYNNRTVTTTTNGRSRTTTTDSRGNIVLSTDPVSSVKYVYDPCGKPSAAISEGDSVCMEYDGAGRRTKLTDPDAGIVTTTYDALGRVKTQRDTNGVLTTYTYNSRGQLTQESTGSTTTYYTYGTGTADKGLLLSVSRDGNTTSYQYDSHARITQEQRTYAWSEATRTMGYAYNSLGQLSERTFPGNLTITYLYDSYGNKWRMFCGTKQLYQISNYNGSSMTEDLGLHIIRTTSFDALGHVTNCQTRYTPDNSFNATQAYTYDNNTGNLTSRTVSGATEYFNYDSMDRLVSVRKNNVVTDSVRYDVRGNITYRKGVGSYSYDDDRPHAVSQIENTGGTVPVTSGDVWYDFDEMNRLCTIEDYESWTGSAFNNGPDRQRWESDNKLYFGDYEETYPNGIENTADRRFTYLDGGTLCITDAATGQKQFYYMVTDHLGSILNIVTEDGGTYYSATYDAWGRQTFVDDFLGFDRGYCGHEMLSGYGLIHMNGRLYDPMMGRFLSPDNYVQEPDNSQNFNRYSYCLNNPLKFIDTDGNFFWLPVIAGALIGGVLNLGMQSQSGNVSNFWQGIKAFAIGALAGGAGGATGGWAFSALGGGAFGAGGFWAGTVSAAASSATEMALQSWGNQWAFGMDNLSFTDYVKGVALSSVLGGLWNGVEASLHGRNFFSGTTLNVRPYNLENFSGCAVNVGKEVSIEGAAPSKIQVVDAPIVNKASPEQVLERTVNSPAFPQGKGIMSVYVGEDLNGIVRYAGKTNNFDRRVLEHLNSNTLKSKLRFRQLKGSGFFTDIQSRIVEQNLINTYKLQKCGGQLYNKINSISPRYWDRYGIGFTIIINF